MPELRNVQVEAWVIGALLDSDGPILKSTAREMLDVCGLVADDFTDATLRALFAALSDLVAQAKATELSAVFVAAKLKFGAKAEFERIQRLQVSNSLSRDGLLGHAEELRRLTKLRALEAFYRDQLERLNPKANPAELASDLEQFTSGFTGQAEEDETGDVDMLELLEDWDAFGSGVRQPYLSTGIETLDEEIGGFVPNLNVIGGLPSVGKSALIAEAIAHSLERGLKVGVFGLEDATKWISKRLLARRLNMPVGKLCATRLGADESARVQNEASEVARLTRSMFVYRRAGIDPATLVQKAKHWVINRGARAVFIDHGGEVQHESKVRDRHDLAVARTYQQLRDLAVNHRVPVVVLCHFNREVDKSQNGIPRLTSFAETEYIARMARLALGLWETPSEPERLRVTILKRTEGERGKTIWLERDRRFALVKRRGGGVVDVIQEQSKKKFEAGQWQQA